MRVLHLGCGRKQLGAAELFAYVGLNGMSTEDVEVIHLDADARLNPDLVCRLGVDSIPLEDDSIDLAIAWHVIEHIGTQGQTDGWFSFWEDLYRVLKPEGWLYAESPYYTGIWAWSDPTHSRAISEHSFLFFNQECYRIPGSMISPYRIQCDFPFTGMGGMDKGFKVLHGQDPREQSLRFAVRARKPLKPWWED
jgi:SAM-dependent methyltransferase